ncbi:MAG: M56 family metallopeptidase [Planctomycetaceae bacterium]|nr:M56 family metallopeptidase [Planctomycetaceae bacterium]
MQPYLYLLLRATFVLSLTGTLVWALMAWTPLHHPRWHRMAWGLVLLQGLVLVPWSFQFSLPSFGWLPLPTSPAATSQPSIAPTDNIAIAEPATDASNPEVVSIPSSSEIETQPTSSLPKWEAAHPLLTSSDSVRSKSDTKSSSSLGIHEVRTEKPTAATPSLITTGLAWSSEKLRHIPWLRWLAYIWFTGLLCVAIRLYINYRILAATLRQTTAARPKWSRELQQLLVELNIRQPIKLSVHRELGPFLCWTPKGYQVVVPVGLWNKLSETERVAVLHHELCHLRRGDLWKAFCARLIVACHWFNPLAWLAASRFDESAEWACDNLLAKESPSRVTELAKALLVATESQQPARAYLTLAVTGGPTFQRIHRLVSPSLAKDTWLKRTLWLSLFSIIVLAGGIQWQLQPTKALNAMSPLQEDAIDSPATAAEDEAPANTNEPLDETEAAVESDETDDSDLPDLKNYVAQIRVDEDEKLKRFVELLQTPAGQLLMKDRAAIAAQDANVTLTPDQIWQQFIEQNFDRNDGQASVKSTSAPLWKKYAQSVQASIFDIQEISQVFKDTAANLDGSSETIEVLKQWLNHEAAPAFVYHTELRSRLHPAASELEERLQDVLVRDRNGQYVIRPARKALVEKRLNGMDALASPLARFEQELQAWANDIAKLDGTHTQFVNTLRMPPFAKYLMVQRLQEDFTLDDPHMDGFFDLLEDATNDTAKGLVLNLSSESYQELKAEMDRFEKLWNYRDALAEPLLEISNKLQNSDELHEKLRTSLGSELGLISVAVSMEYLPVTATEAAQEWLTQVVSKNENGKYELTISSDEDFNSRVEDFYRQFRDLRRRGRIIDEFATQLNDPALATAMQSIPGKQQLTTLVLESIPRPEVDGLQLWFESHFTQTDNGWQLNDGAGEVIDQFINEAAELENELGKDDF